MPAGIEAERDQQARSGQLEGGGQALEHEPHRGLAVTQRLPEVAPHRALEEAHVLDRHRIVEAHRGAELRDVLRGGVGGQQERGGIAGQVQDQEHDHRDAEEHEQRLPEAPPQVRLHEITCSSRATASMCGVCGNMSTGWTHSSR